MTAILAIDTATEACSAALWVDGEVSWRYRIAPREHAKLILPMAEELLGEAGLDGDRLDAVAFGRGPGSFTGVRIGTGVAQAMAFAWEKPVVPVSNLAAMAWQRLRETSAEFVYTAIDARMGEVYFAAFQRGDASVEACLVERVCAPEQVASIPEVRDAHAVGSGFASYREALMVALDGSLAGDAVDVEALPNARYLVELAANDFARGRAVADYAAQPVYLRDQVAVKAKERGSLGDPGSRSPDRRG